MPSHNREFETKFGRIINMIPDGGRLYEPIDQDDGDMVLYIPDSMTDAQLESLIKDSLRQNTDLVRPICRAEKIPKDIIY